MQRGKNGNNGHRLDPKKWTPLHILTLPRSQFFEGDKRKMDIPADNVNIAKGFGDIDLQ